MEIRLNAFKETLEKFEGAIKKRQSRDTGNIGYKTQNEDKGHWQHWVQDTERRKIIRKHTTQKTKKMSNTDPTKINRGWMHVLVKGKWFLLLMKHRSC